MCNIVYVLVSRLVDEVNDGDVKREANISYMLPSIVVELSQFTSIECVKSRD